MPLAPGTHLGPYEVLSPIGAGGMGEVYKARDTRLGRVVAIKILPPDKVADPDRKRRFIQEAKAASALNHPNIVTIYDIGSENGMDFIVMEYVEGRSLDRVIPRTGMRAAEVLAVAIPVADALAKAHANGIVHRDLKPANILVADDGTVKLLDFGLAKLIEDAQPAPRESTITIGATPDRPLTEEGAILGTVAYMSPEQAEGKTVDARSDIFSFGCVLYEMLTGQKAFQGGSRASTLASILKEDPQPLSETAPGIPRELDRMIARCLRKDPNKRWQTSADLRTSLQEFKEDSDSGLTRSSVSGSVPSTTPSKSHKLAWSIAAVAVIALVGTGYWELRGRPDAEPALLKMTPITSFPGTEQQPSFSPDGSQIAFAWDGEKQDNFDIYVKLVDAGTPLRLTHDPAIEYSPVWSPNGNAIAFVRNSTSKRGRAEIVVIPPLGGAERVVAETVAQGAGSIIYRPIQWTPDGKSLIAYDQVSPDDSGLWLIALETGERVRLTRNPRNLSEVFPSISPDGTHLVFVRFLTTTSHEIDLLPLGANYHPSGEPHKVTGGEAGVRGLTFAGNDKIIYTYGPGGNSTLWTAAISGDAPPRQLSEIASLGDVEFSAKARRLAVMRETRDFDISQADLDDSGGRVLNNRTIISSSRFDRFPVYSPDGAHIAFASLRSGLYQVWVADSDGSNPTQLTSFDKNGEVRVQTWSPDSKQIGFLWTGEGGSMAYSVAVSGGRPKKEVVAGVVDAWFWSTDGRWLYSAAERKINKIPAEGGPPSALRGEGSTVLRGSIDGKLVYFGRPGALYGAPTDGGTEREIFRFNGGTISRFAVSPRGIYSVVDATANSPGRLMFYRLPNGPLTPLEGVDAVSQFGISVSPDGKRLVYAKFAGSGSDLMLVENFK